MALFLGVGLATAAGLAVHGFLRWRSNRRKQFGGFSGMVNWTSARMAALRAWESGRSDKLFDDPLAKDMAGEECETIKVLFNSMAILDETGPSRVLPDIVARTKFFDDVIEFALGVGASPVISEVLPVQESLHGVKQVVLLGSGMDTRPWRLNIPDGVQWFEVDRAEVFRFKRSRLAAAGAATETLTTTGQQVKHPLKVDTWKTLVPDLGKPGWSKNLIQHGFKTDVPTLWVLEGLLYYLDPLVVGPLLREMASISSPGSYLLLDTFQQDGLPDPAKFPTMPIVRFWKFAPTTDIQSYYTQQGWPVLTWFSWGEAAKKLGYKPSREDNPKHTLYFAVAKI